MTQRHYYRCVDCLTVAAADGPQVWGGICGLCSGKLECMGRVQAARLVEEREQCKCDGRCIYAKGPDCECFCNGVNHGQGLLGGGFETVTIDRGPVPRLRMIENAKAATVAEDWRAAWGALKAAIESLRAGGYLNGDAWNRLRLLSDVAHKAKKARSHRHRIAAIGEVLPDWRPVEKKELQAALF